jgi:hypothetical protein
MNSVPRLADPLSTPPKSPFLANALAGLAKRRRAIRHKVRSIAVEKVLERTSDEEFEKLEIVTDVGAVRLRLFIWDDRWVVVDARVATKSSGWAWEFTAQGRLVGNEARTLVGALEASVDAAAAHSSDDMERVWKSLLATGPRLSR